MLLLLIISFSPVVVFFSLIVFITNLFLSHLFEFIEINFCIDGGVVGGVEVQSVVVGDMDVEG